MLVLIHIISAIASLTLSSINFFYPSTSKLKVVYVLFAATLTSGTILALSVKTHLTQTCLSGVFYIGFVSLATITARHKLERATVSSKK